MFSLRPAIPVLLLVLVVCALPVKAQRAGPQFRRPLSCEPFEPRTKLEALEWRYEQVLFKGFTQIATLNLRGADVRIDAVELKEPQSATRAIGVVIAMRTSGENIRENRSFIDYEEIDRLLKAFDTAARVNESMTKLASFEARYRTLGDLELIVFRQSRSGIAATLSAGICEPVTASLSLDELDRFKAHIVEAKTRLDEIK